MASQSTSASLRAIAAEFPRISTCRRHPSSRKASAGRLLLAAIRNGAFSGPEYTAFVELVQQQAELHRPGVISGPLVAWYDAVSWLRGRPTEWDCDENFDDDCNLVADLLKKEAERIDDEDGGGNSIPKKRQSKKTQKRGRPVDTDPKADKQVYDAWKSGQYKTQAECARELGMEEKPAKNAIERHRKRLGRKSK